MTAEQLERSERSSRSYHMRARILAVLDELAREGYFNQFSKSNVLFSYPEPNVTEINIRLR